MVNRFTALVCLLPLLGLVGCVGQSAYEKKTEEATNLSRNLAEIQSRNTALVRDNESLRADISGLRAKLEELATAKKRLEQSLVSGEQTPYQFVAELEREKVRLREDLDKIMRAQDDRVRTSSRIYESFLERMKDEIAQGLLRVSELRGTVKLEFLEEAIFVGTKTGLTVNGTTLLRKVADLLKDRNDLEVSVESFYLLALPNMDTSAAQLTPWRVPMQQALSVANYFLQVGVSSSSVRTITRGEFGPDSKIDMMSTGSKNTGIYISIYLKE